MRNALTRRCAGAAETAPDSALTTEDGGNRASGAFANLVRSALHRETVDVFPQR